MFVSSVRAYAPVCVRACVRVCMCMCMGVCRWKYPVLAMCHWRSWTRLELVSITQITDTSTSHLAMFLASYTVWTHESLWTVSRSSTATSCACAGRPACRSSWSGASAMSGTPIAKWLWTTCVKWCASRGASAVDMCHWSSRRVQRRGRILTSSFSTWHACGQQELPVHGPCLAFRAVEPWVGPPMGRRS